MSDPVVSVTGFGKKNNWRWKCEGCGQSDSGLLKEAAGYNAYHHKMMCFKVYTQAQRERHAELELEDRKECLKKQIEKHSIRQ